MAAAFHLQVPLLYRSHFLGQTNFNNTTQKSSPTFSKVSFKNNTVAKFNLYEIMGGRGLCNGEEGIQQELKKSVSKEEASTIPSISSSEEEEGEGEREGEKEEEEEILYVSDDAFEKELLGLTGGFPGGEKGLEKFIEENPPPKKKESTW